MPQLKTASKKAATPLARQYSLRIHVALEHDIWSPQNESYSFTDTQSYAGSKIVPGALAREGEVSLEFYDAFRGARLLDNEVLRFGRDDIKPDHDGYFKGTRRREFKVTVDIPDDTSVEVRVKSASITYTAPGIAWLTDGMGDAGEYSTMGRFYLNEPAKQGRKGVVAEFTAAREENFLARLFHGERSAKCPDIVLRLTKSRRS